MTDASTPFRLLIAGGGVAGLEALLAIRELAGDRVTAVLVSPEDEFVYRPMSVAAPFARGRVRRHRLADIAASLDAELIRDRLVAVDDAAGTALVADGEPIGFDALLVAVGAGSEPALERALTWSPEEDPAVFSGILRDLEEGYRKQVSFVVPPGVAWPLPAYELALMTAWDAWDMNQDDVEVTVYTPEDAPLSVFGAAATAALREDLAEAGVRVETSAFVTEDPEDPRRLVLQPGDRRIDGGRVVALPQAAARPPAGLPVDSRGFILTDAHGKVPGTRATWAAGDAIAFPIKQGGLAAQQADAAAQAIAALAGADVDPAPFQPVLRGVLLTGRGSRWVRRSPDEDDAGAAERQALWWPPTKIAGRYLSPFLAGLDGADADAEGRPEGQLVDLDVERDVPAAADALAMARRRAEGA
jgi:sulfide:quinone oxidoreductase